LQSLYSSVQEHNVLPLTSCCPLHCIFCSHRFQPTSIQTLKPGHISEDRVMDLMDYLDPSRPVIIGEAASRIEEGEPFFHPSWQMLLQELRNRYPRTLLKITTSGTTLSSSEMKTLQSLRPLRICLSLNLIDPESRKQYLGDRNPDRIKKTLEFLAESVIPVEGSMVAMPGLVGWGEIFQSLQELDKNPAVRHIRIFRPGFTGRAAEEIQKKLTLDADHLRKKVYQWQEDLITPLVLEPAQVKDLKARLLGVIADSPADHLGLKRGDIIKDVAGVKPESRVGAHGRLNDLFSAGDDYSIEVLRREQRDEGGSLEEINVLPERHLKEYRYPQEQSFGVIMAYDIDPTQLREVERLTPERGRVLFLTAPAARERVKLMVDRLSENKKPDFTAGVKTVDPEFFGGNIEAAGLLVSEDILNRADEIKAFEPDLILIPDIIFDKRGRDLLGSPRGVLRERLPGPVKFV